MDWRIIALIVMVIVLFRCWWVLWSHVTDNYAGGYMGRFALSLGLFGVCSAAMIATVGFAVRQGLNAAGVPL